MGKYNFISLFIILFVINALWHDNFENGAYIKYEIRCKNDLKSTKNADVGSFWNFENRVMDGLWTISAWSGNLVNNEIMKWIIICNYAYFKKGIFLQQFHWKKNCGIY